MKKTNMTSREYLDLKLKLENAMDVFDEEDIGFFYRVSQNVLEKSEMNMLKAASNFGEKINKRLPLIAEIRKLNNWELTNYFENKQRRLAFQAEVMFKKGLNEKR